MFARTRQVSTEIRDPWIRRGASSAGPARAAATGVAATGPARAARVVVPVAVVVSAVEPPVIIAPRVPRIDEGGRPVPQMLCLGSLSELCRVFNLSESGENIKGLKRALLQNASAFITAAIRTAAWIASGFTPCSSSTRS